MRGRHSFWRVGQTDDYQSFQSPTSLSGSVLGRPTAALSQDGRLNVFTTGTDKAPWVAVQAEENGTAYNTFSSLVRGIDIPVPIADHDGLLRVVATSPGSDRTPYNLPQNWA